MTNLLGADLGSAAAAVAAVGAASFLLWFAVERSFGRAPFERGATDERNPDRAPEAFSAVPADFARVSQRTGSPEELAAEIQEIKKYFAQAASRITSDSTPNSHEDGYRA